MSRDGPPRIYASVRPRGRARLSARRRRRRRARRLGSRVAAGVLAATAFLGLTWALLTVVFELSH